MRARIRSVLGWIGRKAGLSSAPARARKRPALVPSIFDSLERRQVLSTASVAPFVTIPAPLPSTSLPSVTTEANPPVAVATSATAVGTSAASTPTFYYYGEPIVQAPATVRSVVAVQGSTVAPPSYAGQPVVAPSATGVSAVELDTDYVQALYHDVLNRAGTAGEVTGWVDKMTAGLSIPAVAEAFVNSVEHRTDEVDSFYQEFLKQTPDSSAITWITDLLSGASEESVVEAMLDGAEYQDAHPDPAEFIESLYENVLGRDAKPKEITGWQMAMAAGESRQEVVAGFVNSPEAVDQVLEGYYAQFLHREPEGGTSAPWADLLAAGGSASEVAVGILSSPEFIQDTWQS